MNVHYFDRDKGAPPSTDSVQVFLKRPAFSQFNQIPTYRDLGVDLDGKHQLAPGLTLKAKGFYHEHVDDFVSYKDPDYREQIAVSRYDDTLARRLAPRRVAGGPSNTLRLSAHLKDDTHRERDDAYLPFAESSSITGSVGLEDTMDVLQEPLGRRGGLVRLVRRLERDAQRDGRLDGRLRPPGPARDARATRRSTRWRASSGASAAGTVVNAAVARKSRFPTLSQLYSSKNGNTALEVRDRASTRPSASRSRSGRPRGWSSAASTTTSGT